MTDLAQVQAVLEAARTLTRFQAGLFSLQRTVIRSPARWKALLCGRRAGKTVLLGAELAQGLESCGDDEWCVYAARTRQVAKDLIWGKLKALNREFQLGWNFNAQTLTVASPRGGQLKVLGFDKSDEIEKMRGYKLRLLCLDEPATYAHLLDDLLSEVAEPALADLQGTCVIAGTPGVVCAGPWYEISNGERDKWQVWSWTIRENEGFPADAEQVIADQLESRGWTEDHATFQREWLGRWFRDDSDLVYRFLESRNTIREMPEAYRLRPEEWMHSVGVDFGLRDECAWAALATHPHSPDVYVVEAEKHVGMLPQDAADITARYVERYRPNILVGDGGGLGAPYIADWNDRFGHQSMPMLSADKREKRAHIDLLNGDYLSGRLRILAESGKSLIQEVQVLSWAANRLQEDPRYANHCADAHLYAARHLRAYLNEAPATRFEDLSPAEQDAEWERQEAEEGARNAGRPDWMRH